MPRLDTHQLRNTIPREEFDYVMLTGVLSRYSGVRQKINELLKSGVILRVKKGLYVFGPDYNRTPVSKEVLANLIYGPSYISLEYALAFHGLIPERVETVTSVTPKRDKEFDTPLGRFSYRYLSGDRYACGIERVQIDRNNFVLMASPEKALCDYLTLNKFTEKYSPGIKEFLEADLRIDNESWTRLNPQTLLKLNKCYRNRNIQAILEAL
ncbi:MAG: hypothetical protein K2X29_11455 [Candidatus Obscuribacterales bacterium]|nr:hypothetical protein [Candidatus Obscuribacterales bacterium]